MRKIFQTQAYKSYSALHGIVNRTVWIDAEWYVTLKAHSVRRFDDERVAYAFRFRNVTFEPGLSEETFAFDPPPGATESASLTQSTYDSRARLAADTEMSVPDPDVPEGFRFDRARLRVGEETRKDVLSYRRDTNYLRVEKALGADEPHEGEPVAVGNSTGRYEAFGTGAGVTWTCDGYRYTTSGGLGKETLVDVAESIACK